MNLIQMSISGTVMILFTVIIRALFIRRLPKKTFAVLWGISVVRLLLPFSLPCELSVYSLFTRERTAVNVESNVIAQFIPGISAEISSDTPPDVLSVPSAVFSLDIWTVIWLTGMSVLAVRFIVKYVKYLRLFRESLPVENLFIKQWLADHKFCLTVTARYSDRITSPLTYGIFRPVILLPKGFEQIATDDLKFVLAHEYTHIRRFDAIIKPVIIAVLCVHWFNPAVWLMYIIANRDFEFSCDEDVLRMLGGDERSAYAMALIRMEETKNELVPLVNHFGNFVTKERIVCIMKFKKATLPMVAAAVCLIAVTTTAFATSAVEVKTDDRIQQSDETSKLIDTSDPINTTSDDTSSNISRPSDPVFIIAPDSTTSDETDKSNYGTENKLFDWDHGIDFLPENCCGAFSIYKSDESGNKMIRWFPMVQVGENVYTLYAYTDENGNTILRPAPDGPVHDEKIVYSLEDFIGGN